MKKLNLYLGLGLLSLVLLFNACTEDETHLPPVVSFDQASPVILGIGVSSATVTGTIVAEAELESVVISKSTATGGETSLATITDFESGDVTTSDDINYTFTYTLDGITENTTLTVRANDKDAQFHSQSIDIEVTLGGDIYEYTAVLLGAQSSSAPSALDAYNGVRYSFNASNPDFDYAPDHKADIDIIYYYGSTNLATLAAPADPSMDGTGANSFDWTAGWSPKNETLFGSSTINFDDVTNDLEINEISGLSNTKMSSLAVGDVIAFELAEGKKGLIKVTDLTTGSGGTITIHVKVQQ